jgi:UDP-N-acetylmuramate dehydrogenase
LEWVEVLDSKTRKLRKLSNKECGFGYRDSVFKRPGGKRFIVTRVALRLKRKGVPNLEYRDLESYFYGAADSSFPKGGTRVGEGGGFSSFPKGGGKSSSRRISKSLGLRPLPLEKGENPSRTISEKGSVLPLRKGELPTLGAIRRAVLEIRSHKFPDLHECGTAGSFFKNPIISKAKFEALKRKFLDLPGFPFSDTRSNLVKVPLAWILDNICGLKGYAKGNIRLFEKQPIVLVNTGGASAKETKRFAEEIIMCVKAKTGIDIEWEVQKIS